MIRPRWRKILRDIWRNKRRTVLVVLSIAVGVFAVGTVAIMREIVTGDMVASYEAANPPSAILYTDGSFDDDLVEAGQPGKRGEIHHRQIPLPRARFPPHGRHHHRTPSTHFSRSRVGLRHGNP